MSYLNRLQQMKSRTAALLLWVWGVSLLLGGCGHMSLGFPTSSSPPASQTGIQFAPGYSTAHVYPSADVRFHPTITYLAALQTITDLGLQPLSPCLGAAGSQTPWRSTSQESSFESQDGRGYVQVTITPLAPVDWVQRLSALNGVALVYDGPLYCPSISGDLTPVPGRLYFLGYNAQVVYLRITFSAASQALYPQRLEAVSNLGFRLADPCFEKQPPPGAWHTVSQQMSFANGGRLVVATTEANSQAWLAQAQAMDEVTNVETPYIPAC